MFYERRKDNQRRFNSSQPVKEYPLQQFLWASCSVVLNKTESLIEPCFVVLLTTLCFPVGAGRVLHCSSLRPGLSAAGRQPPLPPPRRPECSERNLIPPAALSHGRTFRKQFRKSARHCGKTKESLSLKCCRSSKKLEGSGI